MKTNLLKPKLFHKALLTIASLFFLNISAYANTQKTPMYEIEVIVFENLAIKGWTEEHWQDNVELPDLTDSLSLLSKDQAPLYIKTAKKTLSNKASILNKKGFRVLFHEAWVQRAYADKNSDTIVVEGNNAYGSDLLGTLRLYKTRYAHVNFNLTLDRRIPAKVFNDFAYNQKIDPELLSTHWRFRLKESRKIRPGQIHYLDHPLFGALVKIKKIKPS